MDFSANNCKFVFPAYKYALGMQEITGYTENNIAVSFVTQDVTALMNDSAYFENQCSSPYFRYSGFWNVPDYAIQFTNTYLTDVKQYSINQKTLEPPLYTYQRMDNIAPEEYLFNATMKNRTDYISACPMTADYDYDVNAFKELAYKGGKGIKGRRAQYLTREYGLSGIYSSALYSDLNIPEDKILESLVYKNAEDYEFTDRDDLIEQRVKDYIKIKKFMEVKGRKGVKGHEGVKGYKGTDGYVDPDDASYYSGRILEFGARGFILSYTDDDHIGGAMIPMAYYEFHKPIYSNQDYLKISWNTNGFMEVQ